MCDKAAKEYSSILHYSNTLGNITVNGGTLEIGKNGTGSFAIPDELKLMVNYRNYIIDLKDIVRPNLTVKTGGSFLCTDALSLDTRYLKTVTGLPANKHLVLLCDPAGNAVGGYENKDIWTNDNGNFTTYVRPEDNGKTLTIADLEAGVRYTYTIICTEDTVDLIREEESSNTLPGGNIDLYKHFYTYETAQVKDYDDSASLIVEQDLQRFRVMQNTQTVLESTAVRQIEKLTGQGEITLRGAGFTLADVADVSKLTVESGTIEMPSAASSLTILGGSVKTDQPLLGVQGATGAVYQAVLPLWSTEVSVDGAAYPGLSGTAHADGRTYLYVPADTKLIEAGGRTFFAFFDSESQTVLLKERLNGDGKIDLTVGSAEILDNDLYIYNGVFYKNTNGTTYEVIGTSEENTLAVTKGNVDITLTDVNVANEKGSPVEFAEGVNAVLHLEGENTLTGGDKMPAIHVPEGAKLTVTGEGVLNAAAGLGAAVIGGGRMEKNGEITVDGGTFNLTDNQAAAIGAGAGAETPENSIIVNGGSLKTAGAAGVFGTVPVNADGEGLNRVIVPGESSAAVKVDGNEYHVSYPNDDGRLYLYMVSDRHTVVVGTTDYLVVPLKATVIGAGTAAFTLVEQDGTSVKLQNGDMLVEGSVIRATTKAEPGYGLSEGLNSGTYLLKNENDRLMFIPVSGELNSAYWNGWSAVVEDNTVKYYEAPVEKVLQQMVGVSTQGEEVFICRAAGEGLTMELLIEGQPVSKTVLGSEMQDITYEWDSAGGEGVTLRFTGTGTVALEKLYVSAKADVSNVQIVFEKAYTITLVQPDNTAEDDGGFIELLDENGRRLKDRNPSEPGEQVLTGEKVQVIYRDYDGGSIFDSFTLASGDSKVEKTANPLVLTAGEGDFAQNIAVSVTAHAQPYYVVVIPETVAVNKEGTAVAEITARELKNMQTGDTLDITIHGLNEDGNAVLTRMGANNTLLIPVTDASFAAFAEESLVAQFTENNLTPFFGEKICFGKPIGRQKAGQYTGNLIFKITYQTTRE